MIQLRAMMKGKNLPRIIILVFFATIVIPLSIIYGNNVVIIYPVLHPFFNQTSLGAREQAKKYPNLKLTITAPYTQTAEEQIILMEKYINNDVDAIAIGPIDETLIPIINKAVEYGIPVVCLDIDSPDSKRLSFIGTNNYQAGIEMAKQVSNYLDGSGRIVISVSSMKTRNMCQRVEGFKSYIENENRLSILSIQEGLTVSERIYSNIENILATENFDAIVTMDAESGPMVVRMWKAWGLSIPVFCFDDIEFILEGIKDGIVQASIIQNQYKWGQEAIDAMNKAIRGEQLPEFIDTGIQIITKNSFNK